jgi:hypothetical protein
MRLFLLSLVIISCLSESFGDSLFEKAKCDRSYQQKVELSGDVELEAVLETTSKGNGILSIGGLNLHVFDLHNDGTYYNDGILSVEFSDLCGDGYKEMDIRR